MGARMKTLLTASAVLVLWAVPAIASDPGRGRQIAQQHCAACHSIAHERDNAVIADSPPFEVIGRKHGFDEPALALAVRGPHPKMNFAISGRDADDIAAYIATLAR